MKKIYLLLLSLSLSTSLCLSAPEKFEEQQNQTTTKLYQEVLQVNDQDIADEIVKLINNTQSINPNEKDIILEQYEKDKLNGLYGSELSNNRLLWFSIQTAALLTPETKRQRTFPNDDTARQVNSLFEKDYNDIPYWLKSFDEMKIFMDQSCFSAPEAGILFNGFLKLGRFYKFLPLLENGKFEERDYLKYLKNNIFLVSIDTKSKYGVHGGLFTTAIEIILHDIIHLNPLLLEPEQRILSYENFLGFNYDNIIRPYAQKWSVVAGFLSDIIEDSDEFNSEEKKKIEILSFIMLHEIQYNIQNTLGAGFLESDMVEAIKKIALGWKSEDLLLYNLPAKPKEYYEKMLNEGKDPNSSKVSVLEILRRQDRPLLNPRFLVVSVGKRSEGFSSYYEDLITIETTYEYRTAFLRDTAHFLRKAGLWIPKGNSTKLGYYYDIKAVHQTLSDIYDWFTGELKENGRIYKIAFSQDR
jgi:hypothetical protein